MIVYLKNKRDDCPSYLYPDAFPSKKTLELLVRFGPWTYWHYNQLRFLSWKKV